MPTACTFDASPGALDAGDDLTREQAIAALARAEDKYRSIFEHAVEGIFQTSPDGRYLSVNPSLARIYGYESAEALIAGVGDIQHQLYCDPRRRSQFIDLMRAEGTVTGFESQVHRCDGRVIWISECAREVHDSAGRLVYYEGTVEDITRRKEAEDKERQKEFMAIFAMAKLAESRDPETGAHLERVRSYSRALGQELAKNPKFHGRIDQHFVQSLYLTSPLHDIGKIGVPDCVLLKAGRLNDYEFAIMKSHTTLGAKTLEAALAEYPEAPYLRMARDIAASHHERFDGSGYPAGLEGEEIPLSGRIVALADVYDALTSKRVYKEAFGHHVARSIILNDSSKHFDPDVVDAFIAREQEFIAIQQEYSAEAAG